MGEPGRSRVEKFVRSPCAGMYQAIGEYLINRQAFGEPSLARVCLYSQPQSERETVGWLTQIEREGSVIEQVPPSEAVK